VCPHESTVYHVKHLTAEVAEKLFAAGFHDIDEINHSGLTPLMQYSCFADRDLILWFLSKGARLDGSPYQRAHALYLTTTAAHYLGTNLRYIFFSMLQKHQLGSYWPVLLGPKSDGCLCACSSTGCSPITMMLKTAIEFREPHVSYIDFLDEILQDEITTTRSAVCLEVLRFCTFIKPGLRRTCCKHQLWGGIVSRHSEEDNAEIRKEDRFLIYRLEELVKDITALYEKTGGSISEFSQLYWELRMAVVLAEMRSQDEQYVKNVRDVGVTLAVEEEDDWEEGDDWDTYSDSSESSICSFCNRSEWKESGTKSRGY
jgi:hypothetical protein